MSGRRMQLLVLVISVVLLVAGFAPGLAGQAQTEKDKTGLESNPVQMDDRFGAEFQISDPTSPEAERYGPAIAYNWKHREYLVVWHNTWPDGHRDIYARRVSESGRLLSWFAVSTGSKDRAQPAVAYNATNDQYLVVWMLDVNGNGSVYDIWGRTVAWNGSSMGTEKEIISYPNRTFWTPRIAWNSIQNEYLVVWSAHDPTTLVPTDVAHAILDHTGTKVYGAIISSNDEPHHIDVTYNVAKDEYFVVWRRMWSAADGDILAARLGGLSGSVINPPGIIVVSHPSEDQLLPSVTTNEQHRYLVVWQHAYPGPCCDWDIRGQELNANGGLEGSELEIALSSDDETAPRVAARAGPIREYLVVWQRTTAAGEVVDGQWWDGTKSKRLKIAEAAFWDQESPAVAAAARAPGFLTVYEADALGDPTVHRHIYGRRWVPYANYLPIVIRKN